MQSPTNNQATAIAEMLAMQNALNEMTNGKDWRAGVTSLGKPIDWQRCIYMETAELIDSYPWKHWKSVDAQTDMENVRVELVDIWHFLLSLAMEKLSDEQALQVLHDALEKVHKSALPENLSNPEQVDVHEQLMRLALLRDARSISYIGDLGCAFFASCQAVSLQFSEMYRIYMAKNVLNKFRQDHGYKEGVYIKLWNGKEDNVVMFELMETLQEFSGDNLYKELKQAYNQMVG
ncbi:dUTP diphosphatase [Thiomicrorhabdus sediminis]|uniref:dUTPase n=1 Tax=Thiomicrorhabdus sediminis TaxID=2580412 RepID=A0A4P9K6H5_9GAMM|nr:dUTP diphosphatase [Thiomicrorhabdus sediminis]QCU90060.1 dUTPase [Thiomicrorhabdus sediminis]